MGLEGLWKRRSPEKGSAESVEAESGHFETSRRGLMKLLGGAAVTVVSENALAETFQPRTSDTERIGPQTFKPLQSPEQAFRMAKQRILDESIVATTNEIKSKRVQDALHKPAPSLEKFKEDISTILGAFLPIHPAHLYETADDASGIKETLPVQIVRKARVDAMNLPVYVESKLIGAKERPIRIPELPNDERAVLGNAIYLDQNMLITCKHVAKFFSESEGSIRNDSLDISVVDAQGRFAASSPEQIIHDDPNVSDADIDGLVYAIGFDDDPLADKDGKKEYPGVPIKLTHKFADGYSKMTNYANSPEEKAEHELIRRNLRRSYMIVLPPGEARPIFKDEYGPLPVMGMSGSGVYKNINGKQCLVGILWGGVNLDDDIHHRVVDVGFFLPISAIREVVKKAKRWQLK